MNGLVDFHVHSCNSSDGEFTPEELVGMAAAAGFRAIAITDHDTVAAYPGAIDCGRRAGVEVIPGIELTTRFDGREFHLQLPFIDPASDALRAILVKVAAVRTREGAERIERLRALGFPITPDEVKAKFGDSLPLGVSIAQLLLSKDEARSIPALARYLSMPKKASAFYQDYFMEGRPAYVPARHIDLLEVMAAAPETGGAPVLSHPGAYFQRTERDDLAVLTRAGLRGLEVYTTYHDAEQTAKYLRLAEEFGLVATAGSDFHGAVKPHIPFGAIRDGNYGMVERLRNGRAS